MAQRGGLTASMGTARTPTFLLVVLSILTSNAQYANGATTTTTTTQPRCVVVAPNMVAVGSPFTAYVMVYDADGVTVTLAVTDAQTGDDMSPPTSEATTKGEITKVTLTVPKLPQRDGGGNYYVHLNASTSLPSIILPTKASILVTFKDGHVFTQLARFKYQPGEQVEGHLFSTDKYLMPKLRKDKDMRVELLAPHGTAVDWATMGDTSHITVLQDAAYKFKLQIPDNALTGQWSVRVRYDYEQQAYDDVFFEVSNSNLPALVIAVKTEPKHIYPSTTSIDVTMSASFPGSKRSDRRMKGTGFVEVFGVRKDGRTVSLGTSDPKTTELNSDGSLPKKTIVLDYGATTFAEFHHVEVRSKVMNDVSGLVQTRSLVTGLFVRSPFVIRVSQSAPRYKPGLAYVLKGTIEHPEGKPVPDMEMRVTGQGIRFNLYTTDMDGHFTCVIDISVAQTSALKYTMTTVKHNGRSLNAAEQVTMEYIIEKEDGIEGQPIQTISITKESDVYRFTVNYEGRTASSDYGILHYMATSKGKVEVHGTQPLGTTGHRVINLERTDVNTPLAPQFHFLVFYITRSGDIIADGIWVNVTSSPCRNKIQVDGLDSRDNLYYTGKKLTLDISGDPSSDISTNIFEKRQFEGFNSPLLTKRKLADIMSIGECKQDGGESTAAVFYYSGLTLLTTSSMTIPPRPNARCTRPMPSNKRHRHRRATDEDIPVLKDWPISFEMKSDHLNENGRLRQEIYLGFIAGTWSIQSMGISDNKGFCVSDLQEIETGPSQYYMDLSVPAESQVGELSLIKFVFWTGKTKATKLKLQLQVYEGLCTKARPAEWSTPKYFDLTENDSVSVSWPIVPLKAERHEVLVKVTTVTKFGKHTVHLDKTFVSKAPGREEKIEQTYQLGTLQTPDPKLAGRKPCFHASEFTRKTDSQWMQLNTKVPAEAYYQSAELELSIIGEPLGNVLVDLPANGVVELIAEYPMSCGEQALMYLGPLLYATLYLRQINQAPDEVVSRDHITEGIVYVDKFRANGSYSTWPGKAPSTWLTAYVVKVLAQALEVTSVNETLKEKILDSATYVATRQSASGSFDDPMGILLVPSISGGVDSRMSMTAYVTVSLLEAQRRLKTESSSQISLAIDKACDYLATQANGTNDPYTLSMMAYALLLRPKHRSTGEQLVESLLKLAKGDADKNWLHWQMSRGELTRNQRIRLLRNPVLAVEIETGAYALLAMMEMTRWKEVGAIAMWLTAQHHSNGRFVATQDTVVALQALCLYRSHSFTTDLDQSVNITISNTQAHETRHLINDERNLRHTFTYKLDTNDKNIGIGLSGTGEVRLEAKCTYHTQQSPTSCPFEVKARIFRYAEVSTCSGDMERTSSCLQACYGNSPQPTNMAILYIGLHHLHTPKRTSLDKIVADDENVDHYEIIRNAVIFYLKSVPQDEQCLRFVVTPSKPLPPNTMPLSVHLYDYHDSAILQCRAFYQPNDKTYYMTEKPIKYTYMSGKNEFICGEEPEPYIRDYMKSQKMPEKMPENKTMLNELLCNAKSPMNVYALLVTFILSNSNSSIHYQIVGDEVIYYMIAKTMQVIKNGSLDIVAEQEIHFYVEETWIEFKEWVEKYADHPHIIIAAKHDVEANKNVLLISLHLNKGGVYIQRLAPYKKGLGKIRKWLSQETRTDFRNLSNEYKTKARANKSFLTKDFRGCQV